MNKVKTIIIGTVVSLGLVGSFAVYATSGHDGTGMNHDGKTMNHDGKNMNHDCKTMNHCKKMNHGKANHHDCKKMHEAMHNSKNN